MKISIVTLFPRMFEGFLTESIVGKAQKNGHVQIAFINLRDFAKDSYGTVDDRPYGGGAGMVLRVDVLHACLESVLGKELVQATKESKEQRAKSKIKVILTSAKGHTYSQAKAEKYAQVDHLVIIAGHYEGVDERILHFIDEEISIGQYVLTGGELPAAIIADSVVRLLPGVLKKEDAAKNESFSELPLEEYKKYALISSGTSPKKGHMRLKEAPHYTRPEEFLGFKVPDVLKSGNHQEIKKREVKKNGRAK